MKFFKKTVFSLFFGLALLSCGEEEKKENTRFVNIYSSRLPELMAPIYKAFQEKTGIEVNSLYLGKSALKRLMQEKELTKADIILVSDIGRLADIKSERLSQAVNDETINKNIPSEYRDTQGHWFGITRRIRAIAYSTDRVSLEDINGYNSFSDDRFKGKVCSRSFSHPYNVSMITAYDIEHGSEKTDTWLRKFYSNLALGASGVDRDQIKLIAAGKCDIAPVNHYYYAAMQKEDSTKELVKSIKLVPLDKMGQGAYANISGVAITKYAQNIEEAYQFIRFLSDVKAQTIFAQKDYEIPVNVNVSFNSDVLIGEEENIKKIPLTKVAENREKILQKIYTMGFN